MDWQARAAPRTSQRRKSMRGNGLFVSLGDNDMLTESDEEEWVRFGAFEICDQSVWSGWRPRRRTADSGARLEVLLTVCGLARKIFAFRG